MDHNVDYFISRRGGAAEIAREVAAILRAAGYTVKLQDSDIVPADNFVGEMHDMLIDCRHFIAIMTRDYASSPYTRAEWTNFFKLERESNGTRRLIPLRVEDFKPEGLFAARVYADLVGVTDPQRRREIVLAAVAAKTVEPKTVERKPVEPKPVDGKAAAPAPPSGKKLCGVPPRNPDFTGRRQLMTKMHRMLHPRERHTTVAPIAIHGLGGVGKTSLAAEYARLYQKEYAGVWWAPAESRAVLLGSLAEFAGVLDPRLADGKEAEKTVKAGFEKLAEGAVPWLLIYDNVRNRDDIADLTPDAGARLVLTTRWTDWSGYAEEFPIDVLAAEAAADLLLKHTGRSDREGATRLASALGCLPLALHQAGGYAKLTGITFDGYAQRCQELIARAPWGAVRQPTVRGTFTIAIEKAIAECPATDALLAFLAVLASERVRLDLVDDTILPEDKRSEALMALSAVSLIAQDPFPDGTEAISIHRLVREAMKWRLEQSQRLGPTIDKAVARLADAFPDDGFMEPKSAPRCKQLLPHALTLCQIAQEGKHTTVALAQLLDAAANYLNGCSEYAPAEPLYRSAIAIGESLLGPDHRSIGEWKNNLGNLLLNSGRNREAEIAYREAILIGTKADGGETPRIATRINNLGVVMLRSGQYPLAEELFRKAIAISEKAYGPRNRHVAARINNLAVVLAKTNRLAEAEELHRRAIALGSATLGEDHPRVTYWRTELANAIRAAQRYDEAEAIYRDAIARLVEIHGDAHLSVGNTRDELARLLLEVGRAEDARGEAAQALAIREKSLGADHDWTRRTADLLADALAALGRGTEAAQVRARYARREAS